MNVTFIFLWENLHGHFEGNLCLMYVVAILLFLSIFIELGKDSFGYSNGICSNGLLILILRECFCSVGKKPHAPSFVVKILYLDIMWLSQRIKEF